MEEKVAVFKMVNNILIQIATKDRASEVAFLLQSLRTQTEQNFDIVILSDGCNRDLQSFYFIQYMVHRLKLEGHEVYIIRNETPSGVSRARQTLVDFGMTKKQYLYFLRVDDDVILQPDYLDKLLYVINHNGYDIASGITTPFIGPDMKRDIDLVSPIIGECQMNDKGELILNNDDCGTGFTTNEILPSHHFRSCAMFKREVFEAGVNYDNRLSRNGFREEQIISFKAILKGFKIGVDTSANALHLMTPSGGERDSMDMTGFNQKIFEETVKRMFEENGNFLEEYNKKLGITTRKRTDLELLSPYNLIYNKKDVSLI